MAPGCPGKLFVGRENLEDWKQLGKKIMQPHELLVVETIAPLLSRAGIGLTCPWKHLITVPPSTLGVVLLLASPIAAQDNFEKTWGKFNGMGDPDFQPALVTWHWEIPVQGEAPLFKGQVLLCI